MTSMLAARRFAALALFAAAPLAAQATRPSFNGTWILDASKSTSVGVPGPSAATLNITTTGDTLRIARESTSEIGVNKTTMIVGNDGKAWSNAFSEAGYSFQMSTTMTWDGKVMVLTSTGNVEGADVVQTERWTMADDANSFTSDRNVSVNGQEFASTHLVFAKK